MLEAIKNFEKLEAENKVAILGQMMELGEYSRAEHEKIFAATENLQNTKRVFVGAGFEFVNQLPATRSIKWFETTEDLAAWYRQQQFENTSILIKGSRKNELEKILQA
jgi:UDP-N-acetylmuramoyl-tripeptide--D-alanyl-D-alanine ligase